MMRPIDISGHEAVAVEIGEASVIAFVALADLRIDDTYQRGIEARGWRNIEKIAREFDWAKFSPLMVSRRDDGRLVIVDGQHRAHAAALVGLKEVPALISRLTPKQEASAFAWINGSVAVMTPNQIFKAALAAFEHWAVQCDAVVARAGCRLMPYNSSASTKRPGQVYCVNVYCVNTVRKFVDLGQDAALAAVLEGVAISPVRDEVKYYNTYGLTALVPVVAARGVTDPKVIAAFLTDHNLEKTAAQCWRLKELPEYQGVTFRLLFARAVATLFNAFCEKQAEGVA